MNKTIHLIKPLTVLLLLVFSLFLNTPAFATVVRNMNLREIVADSDVIVKATVISKDTVLDSEESGRIVTYWTVQISECLKGACPNDNELVFKQIGQGEYTVNGNRIRQNLFFPEYEIGKTYVFFLPEAHPRTGMLAPVGLYQGVYEVKTRGDVEVVPALEQRMNALSRGLTNTSGSQFLNRQITATETNPTYSNFKSMIQALGE